MTVRVSHAFTSAIPVIVGVDELSSKLSTVGAVGAVVSIITSTSVESEVFPAISV